jgi:hypothetical protein
MAQRLKFDEDVEIFVGHGALLLGGLAEPRVLYSRAPEQYVHE